MNSFFLPVAVILLLIIINLTICYCVARTLIYYGNLFTLKASIRAVGWSLPTVTIAACTFALMISGSESTPQSPFFNLSPKGALAVIIPLAMGTHVASIFASEDEPALEVVLTYFRPFTWVILERTYLLIAFYVSVGIVTTILGNEIRYEGPEAFTIISWLGPAIFLAGVGLRVSIAMRNVVFGITIVLLIWGMMGFFTYLLSEVIPGFWPVFLYPPDGLLNDSEYLINRAIISLLGNVLLFGAAITVANREVVLTGENGQVI